MAILARRGLMAILALWMIAFIFCLPAQAQGESNLQLNEQKIKAGLVYNFLKYIEWPDVKSPSISVCIFGADPIDEYLKPLQGRSVNKRVITVRNIYKMTDVDTCQLLFVNDNEREKWPALRDSLAGKSVLTVSDFSGFSDEGGMIQFGRRDNRVNVELNMAAVKAAHLRVYDRLLRLVTVMNPGTDGR